MLLSTFLKEYFDYSKVVKSYSVNCSKDSRVLNFVAYDDKDNEYTLNIYISKDINKVLSRATGFNLNSSSNNGVCLYSENIDYFVHYDSYKRTYRLF